MTYRLFLDMDGVLVDFVRGVKELTGRWPRDTSIADMWKAVAGVSDFYARLSWMSDGRELWNALTPYSPILLTGVPYGKGWVTQKHTWIRNNLSPMPACIIKYPGVDKLQSVFNAEGVNRIPENEKWILIDDTPQMSKAWTRGGGIFILHTDAESSLTKFLEIIISNQ